MAKKTFSNPLDRKSGGTTASPQATIAAETLLPGQLRLDGGTQMRPKLDESKIAEYAELLVDGVDLGKIGVIYDGTNHWMWDGFHRIAAHLRVNGKQIGIAADIKPGEQRDAVLLATRANAEHGLPRSRETKINAVETLLRDSVWGTWSSRKIARMTGTSHAFVSKRREILEVAGTIEPTGPIAFLDRHGNTTTMETGGIADANKARAKANINVVAGTQTPTDHTGHASSVPIGQQVLEDVEGYDRAGASLVEGEEPADGDDHTGHASSVIGQLSERQAADLDAMRTAHADHAANAQEAPHGDEDDSTPIGPLTPGTAQDGTATPALPADLLAFGWELREVGNSGTFYAFRPRIGEASARSTSTTKDLDDVIDEAYQMQGEIVAHATPDNDVPDQREADIEESGEVYDPGPLFPVPDLSAMAVAGIIRLNNSMAAAILRPNVRQEIAEAMASAMGVKENDQGGEL